MFHDNYSILWSKEVLEVKLPTYRQMQQQWRAVREEKESEEKSEKRVSRKKINMREKVEKLQNIVFSNVL